MAHARARRELFYIGSYTTGSGGHGRGIYLALRHPQTGGLELREVVAKLGSPTFLAWHPELPVLYVTSEPEKSVSAFRASPAGSLELLSVQPTGGDLPCHVSVHPCGRFVLVANYGDGSFSVHRVGPDGGFGPDGGLGSGPRLVQRAGGGPNPDRQDGPHVHCTLVPPDGRHVLVTDLGADAVTSYPFDARSGTIDQRKAHTASTAPGAGPRHMALDPGLGRLYVSCELDSTVTVYALEDEGARLRWLQRVPATGQEPTSANFPSEILLDDVRHLLYVGNRGANVIGVFSAGTGPLEPIARVPTGGHEPRHFALAGDHLYVGNQRSDNIAVFALGSAGTPGPASEVVPVPSPACLLPEPPGGLARRFT